MQLRHFANSLILRVLLLAMLITAVGTAMRFAILSNIMLDGIGEVVTAHLVAEASYVAGDIDEKIRVRKRLLETLARQLPARLLGQPQELEAWLAERQTLVPHFSLGMTVVPLSGHGVIAESPVLPSRRDLDFTAADWFLAARDRAGFAIGKPGIGHLSQHGLIVMAAPIFDAGGRVAAVISGTTLLDTPGFLNLIQNNKIGDTGGVMLISPHDKLFVAASMPNLRLQPTPVTGVNRLHDQAMAGWRGSGITVNAFGVEELVAVHDVPSASWFVVARMPTKEAFQTVNASRRTLLLTGGTITLIVLAAFAVFLFFLFRPLRRASQQIHRMADGQLPLMPLSVGRRDEVGEMVEGFNYLVDRVRANEARMTELAHHDALTRLPNRLSFLLRAEQTASLICRQQGSLALMFIDLDGFKPINDVYGHEVGDQLLQQVAIRFGDSIRAADMVARFGGDEFVMLLTDMGDREDADRLAEKVIAHLSQPYRIGDLEMRIGASIGIAFLPEDAANIESLIVQADAAMYDAKRAGRSCWRFAHRAG